MIALSDYLILAAILFGLSVAGIFLNRKNVIILLMAIELMLLAVNMNFIAFSYYMDDIAGQARLAGERGTTGVPRWAPPRNRGRIPTATRRAW